MCVKPCACCSTDAAPFLGWVSRMVLQHRGRMVAIARQEGVLAEDALDCAQEAFQTFLLVPQARALVDAPEDCARLLSTLVRNAARNRRRRHHQRRGGELHQRRLSRRQLRRSHLPPIQPSGLLVDAQVRNFRSGRSWHCDGDVTNSIGPTSHTVTSLSSRSQADQSPPADRCRCHPGQCHAAPSQKRAGSPCENGLPLRALQFVSC